jgi:hypothetical protein
MTTLLRALLLLTGAVMLVTLPANRLTLEQQIALTLMGSAVAIRGRK